MPRKEANNEHDVTIYDVEGYHCGDYDGHKVYTSDRYENADRNYRVYKNGEWVFLPSVGIEWETQNWGITDQKIYANLLNYVVFQNFPKDLWKIEDDGSLRDGCDTSAECITQPMTKAFVRNHYRDFKSMWQYAKEFGISCDKTGDCGMHVHISLTMFGRTKKAQDEAIRKLYYIINKHYDFMVSALHRNPNSVHYCKRMSTEEFADEWNPENYAKFDYRKAKDFDFDTIGFVNDHGYCMNLSHYYRHGNIELRLVGGQKNYPCFRNTMETVFHLIEASKSISWKDCDDVTKIFSGCNQYVFNRLETYVHSDGHITIEQLNAIRGSVKEEKLL